MPFLTANTGKINKAMAFNTKIVAKATDISLSLAFNTGPTAAIAEYNEVSERYEFLSGQISDVETSRAELNLSLIHI